MRAFQGGDQIICCVVRKNKLRVFGTAEAKPVPLLSGYQAAYAVLFTSVHGPFPFCEPILSRKL